VFSAAAEEGRAHNSAARPITTARSGGSSSVGASISGGAGSGAAINAAVAGAVAVEDSPLSITATGQQRHHQEPSPPPQLAPAPDAGWGGSSVDGLECPGLRRHETPPQPQPVGLAAGLASTPRSTDKHTPRPTDTTTARNGGGGSGGGGGEGGGARPALVPVLAPQRCKWTWRGGRFSVVARWAEGTPPEMAEMLAQELAQDPKNSRGQKPVSVQWLSPQQLERRFPSAAEALEYLRTFKGTYGDPNSPIVAFD
jgi:hypothetical protein